MSSLDYATPQQRRGVVYYVLVGLNCVTLLAGIILACLYGKAIADHDGWGQFFVAIIGVPAAVVQLVIGTLAVAVADRWRDSLTWLAGLSMLLNGGVTLLNLLGPRYGGC